MDELIQLIEFRSFSYEDDPESVVDMQRCNEILEGSWLDNVDTCRMNYKIVARTPGSSWVLAFRRTIFGYADLIPAPDQIGYASSFKLHPDYISVKLAQKLVKGLKEQAIIRNYKSLMFHVEKEEIKEILSKLGLKSDRTFHWLQPSDLEAKDNVSYEKLDVTFEDMLEKKYYSYLGSPAPPKFVIARSFMSAEYGVFHYTYPKFYSLKINNSTYVGCYDGREWHVFRETKKEEDKENIYSVLSSLANIERGRILISSKAAKIAGIEINDKIAQWTLITNLEGDFINLD